MSLTPRSAPELHEDYDREAWPRFIAHPWGQAWVDGVVYIRYDKPTSACGIALDGTIVWSSDHTASFDTLQEEVSWGRPQVSPLYVMALVEELSRGDK